MRNALDSHPPTVSLILVTHNSAAALSRSLPLVSDEIERAGFGVEVVVCDNASTDKSVSLITTALPEVTVVNERDNRGFAGGCNRAVARARGEYLLFLNPDVYLDEGTMGALVSELRRRPDAGAVVGRMRDPSGAFQPTCRQLPTRANIFLSRGSVLSRAFGSMGYTLPDFPIVTAVPAAAATCWLMPRTLFEDVGGFDERFFMFMEDTDLSLRIALAGKKIYFVPHAGAEHAWGAGASATEQQRVRWHSQSVLAYYQKRFPGLYSRLVLPLALKLNQALRRALG